MPNPKVIAAGLTEDERIAIGGREQMLSPYVVRGLVLKKLIEMLPVGFKRTPLGLAVKAELKKEKENEKAT